MSIALVIIHKTQGGHKWSNTHAVTIGAQNTQWPTEADIMSLGADTAFTDANTGATPAAKFLHRLVAFERYLHFFDTAFTDIYVTDGKRQDAGEPNVYFTTSLVGNGLSLLNNITPNLAVGGNLMVGSMAWLIHRNIVGLGHKPGRLFIRGGMRESDVISNGPRMAAWTDATSQGYYATQLTTAQAKIATHLSGGTDAATAMYSLPIYVTPKTVSGGDKVGELIRTLPVLSFSSMNPVNRQVQRGKRRKKVTTVVV